jgi:hypothetical protein
MRLDKFLATGTGALLAIALAAAPAVSATVGSAPLWEATGLKTPESALPDLGGAFAYVSNVNGKPTDKDGNGFISKVSLKDGKVTELEWVKGLNGPKGMALSDGKLYVADIDQLVAIDPANGKIVARFDAPGAKFLNDVTADGKGSVYVSDSTTSTIWRLADGKLEKWLEGEALKFPNGLHAQGDKLIVAGWGAPGTSAEKSDPANLLEVSTADKSVKNLGDGTAVGNLDGIEPLGNGNYLVTDWVAGALYEIEPGGKAKQLLDLNQGSADIAYVPSQHLLLIPMMMDNKVAAYRVK